MKKLLFVLISLFLALSVRALAGSVDINTADAHTLALNIKGVGAKKAAEIVRYRGQHGLFKSIEELENIKGIGPKLIEKNRANLLIVNNKAVVSD
ncbi:MAG TPA: helix-hairpin-helix domain-containing protein [Gammaproteobacteria bacterium]|nr:helix-hairpin-helix domain-containing protein [Gammaproteobacteria bacterium]